MQKQVFEEKVERKLKRWVSPQFLSIHHMNIKNANVHNILRKPDEKCNCQTEKRYAHTHTI